MSRETKVIPFGGGFVAMRFAGFLFWKEWTPISWDIKPTREEAEKEAEGWRFYVSCRCKSGAM